ncbi:MAG: DUF418 domain-containing protein [Desulfobulbaceae bacterium]|nr:DUF418 domain-containing protein [Desulfobulbaceae bacterium]HIJ78921.1 DUF418 domain-containing protein [Deltaproteobacteria bacterium]
MANISDSPNPLLPLTDPPGLVNPSLATPRPAVASARIDGYDFARALAVIGMVLVNFNSIFRLSQEDALPYSRLADALCGRAAVLFVMLAGVGLTLLARRPLLAGTAEAMALFRRQILKRCLVLFVMGNIFRLFWHGDILHFYALFLGLGVFCLQLPNKWLWLGVVGIWLTATTIFVACQGGPTLPDGMLLPDFVVTFCDDLLLGGYYAAFPWFAFLLMGVWFGRPEVMNRPASHGRIFLVCLVIFVIAEQLLAWGDARFFMADETEMPLAVFFFNDPFPASPLFALSGGAGAMMVLIGSMYLSRLAICNGLVQNLKYIGKLSLTIYVGHVLLGLALVAPLQQRLAPGDYSAVVTCLTLALLLGQGQFARFWCNRFERGPLEWLFRKLSGTG